MLSQSWVVGGTVPRSPRSFNGLGDALSHMPVLVSGDVFAEDASPIMTSPTAVRSEVDHAITRARDVLLATQAPDGHWVGERETKMVRYLRERQLADGGYSLYDGGSANLSATIKAYFAMKVAGVSIDDPAMAAARAPIRERGGPVEADVFTKILLAPFGEGESRAPASA